METIYEVLLFDLVGVLVEPSPATSEVFLSWTEMRPEDFWRFWQRSPAARAFDTGQIGSLEYARGLINELRLTMSPEEFLRLYRTLLKGSYNGTEALLAELSKRYRLACFSNINEALWPQIQNEFGIGQYMNECYLSYQIGLLKPDRAAYEYVIKSLQRPPERIVFFDDGESNIKAAIEAGIHGHVTRGLEDLQSKLAELGIV